MFPKVYSAVLITFAVFSAEAHAAWSVGGGNEYYTWHEYVENPPLTPKESGIRYALNWKWEQNGGHGLLFGYHGRAYFGRVDYDTFTQIGNTPVSTTTDYFGVTHEGRIFFRASYSVDYIAGLGIDSWRRDIGSNDYQIEDYEIIYLRHGVNFDRNMQKGFHGGGGLKYPFYAREDAHLDDLGYFSNPILTPGKQISFYAEFGYRINGRFDVTGYYDSWRFKRSSNVYTTDAAGGTWAVWQPKSSMDALGVRVMYTF